MTFREAVALAEGIMDRMEEIEGKPWGADGTMIEMTKQVGELAKLVMSREGYYFDSRADEDNSYVASDAEIADELADVLYTVIRMARHYKIDLLKAHLDARQLEQTFLDGHTS